ncbi:LysR family transcriptional regulator [Yoonia sp. I 8.24]|uniref:LysR family transcriptional regulator n=1 Tax=Yoonia sp. I 8.24 TaxID=1537229 RepID=UPI001EDDB71E|nr:LysR family transcriptional regulator [Yoonia sp. I 8.24]
MSLPRVSLQALDAFERVARTGSIQAAAAEMGLSISSISHQIARLEDQIGTVLFDRTSRPFVLTREGHQALQHLSKGLHHIRRAADATVISGLLHARSLRIGMIDEFESNVTPALATFLAKEMPKATLSIRNIPSHQATDLLQKGEIDLAVVAESDDAAMGVTRLRLMRDPFVLALPDGHNDAPADIVRGRAQLDFLRFNPNHLIGKQIAAHLARNQIDLPRRLDFDSVQSIMAIIAGGAGWSIITPVGFVRSQRFAQNTQLHPLPLPAFSRRIALVARDTIDIPTREAVATLLRQIMRREIIQPACAAYPWLTEPLDISELSFE